MRSLSNKRSARRQDIPFHSASSPSCYWLPFRSERTTATWIFYLRRICKIWEPRKPVRRKTVHNNPSPTSATSSSHTWATISESTTLFPWLFLQAKTTLKNSNRFISNWDKNLTIKNLRFWMKPARANSQGHSVLIMRKRGAGILMGRILRK